MLIADLIKDLQKLQDEYPNHDVIVRNIGTVDRVEASSEGPEIVMTHQNPVQRCGGTTHYNR